MNSLYFFICCSWIHCGVCNNAMFINSGNSIIKISNSYYLVWAELGNSAGDTHVIALLRFDYYKSRSVCRSALHSNMQSRVVTGAGVYPFAATVGCVSYNYLYMPLIKWQGVKMFLTSKIFTSVKYYTFKWSSVVNVLSWPLLHSLFFHCSGYLLFSQHMQRKFTKCSGIRRNLLCEVRKI